MSSPFGLVWSVASTVLMGLLMLVVLVVPACRPALKLWVLGAIVVGALGAIPISAYATRALVGR